MGLYIVVMHARKWNKNQNKINVYAAISHEQYLYNYDDGTLCRVCRGTKLRLKLFVKTIGGGGGETTRVQPGDRFGIIYNTFQFVPGGIMEIKKHN